MTTSYGAAEFPRRQWTPIAITAASAFLLSLCALLSLIDDRAALVASIVVLVGTALLSAEAGILLTIIIVPFTYFLGLSASSTAFVAAAAISCSAGRILFDRVKIFREVTKSPYALVLAAFTVLLLLHLNDTSMDSLRGAAFMGCTLLIFLGVRFTWAEKSLPIADCMTASVLIGCTISLVFLHGPVEWLVAQHPRLENLRLSGVFDEANAAGRYLIPVFFFLLLRARDRTTPINIGLFAASGICLAATMSKGALLAVSIGSMLLLLIDPRRSARTAITLAFAIAVMAIWIFGINPPLQSRAARIWDHIEAPNQPVSRLATAHESQNAGEVIANDLRVGTSSQMIKTASGEIKYVDRPYSLWHTGQRDILWTNGVAVISEHPLWGIGYHRWRPVLSERTGYPFISPHNGLMEVAGAYGLAGAALYLLLAFWLVPRSFMLARRMIVEGNADMTLAWATVSTIAMLVFELTDVSTSLAATLPAIWFWVLLAIQEQRLAPDVS